MPENEIFSNNLTELVLATGALGVAAAGIVDGLKWWFLGKAGFQKLLDTLGQPLMSAIKLAYGGQDAESLLKAQYLDGRSAGDLPRTLRQGVRIGLTKDNAAEIANSLGVVVPEKLQDAADKIMRGDTPDDDDRSAIARYELAADARITAGLGLAEVQYKGTARLAASIVAVLLALVGGAAINFGEIWEPATWIKAIVVGVVAVPLAPVAKDVAKGLQAAAKAIRSKI